MIHTNIKMIVTDLDRTLLRSDKTISPYTKEVFDACRRRGLKVSFATARPVRNVTHFLDVIHPDAVIYHNGSLVLCEGKQLATVRISIDIAREFLLSMQKAYPEMTLSVEIEDVIYINFDIPPSTSSWIATRSDFSDLPPLDADKMIVGVKTPEDMLNILKYLPDSLYIEISDKKLGLIMHKGATKLNGIRAVAQKYGFALENILSFGDDYNDIEMLKACGVGVAMENAIPKAKEAADFITDHSDNDGVAKYLSKYILRQDD